MSLIEKYIFRNVMVAFVACLCGLTLVIWITQALREMDLLTGKGQTILIFLTVTGLSLPALIAVIAPVALFIGTIYALNKLNGDSELIVMSAAGVPPLRLLRPFAVMGLSVALLVGWMTVFLLPESMQGLRDLMTRIRADFVANIVKEGQFTTLDSGITFHYRERAGDVLLGIFFQDRREQGKTAIYLAERGQTAEINGQSYLVLEKGSIQRMEGSNRDTSIVAFDRYAIDLSAFGQDGGDIVYKPRERATGDLLSPNEKDGYYQMQKGRFRAELHDRFAAPLYPIAFVLIAFAALGEARTTRQGRGAATAVAVIAMVGLRIAGFAASSAAVRSQPADVAMYAVPLGTCVMSLVIITQGPAMRAIASRFGTWQAQQLTRLMPARLRSA